MNIAIKEKRHYFAESLSLPQKQTIEELSEEIIS